MFHWFKMDFVPAKPLPNHLVEEGLTTGKLTKYYSSSETMERSRDAM
jgi:hypothetical protein